MNYLIFFLASIFLFSCSNKEFETYSKIVDIADQFKYYDRDNDTFVLYKVVIAPEDVQNLKNIFKRHIEPELQKRFTPQNKIEIYKQSNLLGVFLINGSHKDPFVNFKGENLWFGFKCTYGIGMSL